MKKLIALLFALTALLPIFAQELDELRLGMPVADAISVFTRYRSCENAVLSESLGQIAWSARLLSREARVIIGIRDDKVFSLSFEFFLEPEDSGDALFETLAANEAAAFGPAASVSPTKATWNSETAAASLQRFVNDSSRSLLLLRQIR